MNEQKSSVPLIIGLIVVVVIAALGIWYFSSASTSQGLPPSSAVQTSADAGTATNTTVTTTASASPMSATVTYTNNGFSPSSVIIAKGGTVTFINQGGDELWVASNPHPIHNGYDGTTLGQHCTAGYSGPAPFDQCSVGTTYSFTFQKVGTWGYHNHGNHSDTGTIIVVGQ